MRIARAAFGLFPILVFSVSALSSTPTASPNAKTALPAPVSTAPLQAERVEKINVDFERRLHDQLDPHRQPVSVIVEFDVTDVEAQAVTKRKAAHITKDNAEIRAYRVNSFRERKADVLKALTSSDFAVAKEYTHLPMSLLRLKNIDALARLENDSQVRAIYEDIKLKPSSVDSASLGLIQQPTMINNGFTGAGTTVAVIDSGVNYTLPDFGCVIPGAPSTCHINYYQNFADSSTALDSSGHGSNVSAIVLGVAPGANVAALNVFGASTSTDSSTVIAALDWAINNRVASLVSGS